MSIMLIYQSAVVLRDLIVGCVVGGIICWSVIGDWFDLWLSVGCCDWLNGWVFDLFDGLVCD